MKALIFAAGKGERLRPLTTRTPKPLIEAGGCSLIEHHLRRLADIGVTDVIVNTSWLAECFPPALGDGSRWNLRIVYSYEGPEPLETGGGMQHALPLLGDAPFLLLNGDIHADVDLAQLPRAPRGLAHLVLVDNPAQHPRGDFVLHDDGRVTDDGDAARLTYAGIGVYDPRILTDWRTAFPAQADARLPRFGLAPLLRAAMARGQIHGTHHRGTWTDVGTPERLAHLRSELER